MKSLNVLLALLLMCVFTVFSGACRKKTTPTIDLPEQSHAARTEIEPGEPKQTEEPGVSGEAEEISKQLRPVFFDFDKFNIRDDQISSLQNNARVLTENPDVKVVLEGHCDERGTDEYNLALGERRAGVVKDYLIRLGIEADRLSTVSYGESRPFALGHDETSWQANRRAHPTAMKP